MTMRFTSEQRIDGIVERGFTLGATPGILWTPGSASPAEPVPLILAGQPGGAGLDVAYPRLRGRAQHAAWSGFATATLELPGGGDRPPLPGVDQAVPKWQAAVDALLEQPGIAGPVGYSGGVISIGTRLAAIDPRIAAAVLFAGSFVPRSILEEARQVTIPLYVLLQWDDEGNDRQMALDLFDAFGSAEKTLNANMGGHTGVPQHANDEAHRFFTRHLRSFGG